MVALPDVPSIVGHSFPDAPHKTFPLSGGRFYAGGEGAGSERHPLGDIVLELVDGNSHLRPAKTGFRRGPLADFTSSAGVNPACGKVPAHAGTLVRR